LNSREYADTTVSNCNGMRALGGSDSGSRKCIPARQAMPINVWVTNAAFHPNHISK